MSAAPTPLLSLLQNYGQDGLNRNIRGVEIGNILANKYNEFIDLIPETNTPAVCEPLTTARQPLTHARIKQFVRNEFNLERYGIKRRSRIAILLPNGPELALTVSFMPLTYQKHLYVVF